MANGDQQTFVNPQTGERIQWNAKTRAWVPAQGESTFDKLTKQDNELDPVTGQPKAGVASRVAQSAGAGFMGLLPGLKQMFTGEMTPEEAKTYLGHEAKPEEIKALKKRLFPGELQAERLTSLPLIGAAKGYAELKPSWEAIKSVLPEAIGGGIGTVAGGEATGAVTKAGMKNVVAPATKATLRNIFGAGKRDVERITADIDTKQQAAIDKATTKREGIKKDYATELREREQAAKTASAKETTAATKKQVETGQGPVVQRMNEMADKAQAHIGEIEEKVGKQENQKWEAFKEKMDNPTVRMSGVAEAIQTAQDGLAGENVPIFKSVLKEITKEDPMAQASVFKGGPSFDVKEMLKAAKDPKQREVIMRNLQAQGFLDETGQETTGGKSIVDLPLDNARKLENRLNRVLNGRELPRPVARAIGMVSEAMDHANSESIVKKGGPEALREYRQLKKDYRQYRETFSDKDSPLRKVSEAKDPGRKLGPITGDTGARAIDYLGRYKNLGAKPELLGRIRALHKAVKELPGGGGKMPGEVEKPTLPRVPEKNIPSAEDIRRDILTKKGSSIPAVPLGGMVFISPRGIAMRLLARAMLRNKKAVDWLAK